MTVKRFQRLVLDFYLKRGRRELPWRKVRDPYAVLVSEVILQQTQVSRGIERFPRFLRKFPTIQHLARASQASVLREWLGLGYNRRALNLHRAAKEIVSQYSGHVPSDSDALLRLPGIGPYTANAVAAFAFNKPVVVLDTNIRRVFLYHFFSDQHNDTKTRKQKELLSSRSFIPASPASQGGRDPEIENKQQKDSQSFGLLDSRLRGNDDKGAWNGGLIRKVDDQDIIPLIQKTLYRKNPRLWYSALMDYGSLGEFGENPNRKSRSYTKQSSFEGSRRFVRAKILDYVLKQGKPGAKDFDIKLHLSTFPAITEHRYRDIIEELSKEGFLEKKKTRWYIKS